jgi:hypothetical protein
MVERSYATGHGDTVEDLLKELEWQLAEFIVLECAKVGDSGDALQDGGIARMIKQHFGIES